jgi:ABC-type antimicrobial peptide transport system permease subunit
MNSPTKAHAIAGYREALREIAPSIPLVLIATLRYQMEAALGSQRAITLMSSFFAGLALFLSAIGLYGMLSSSVAQRTGEIGIRVALGAQRNTVVRMILRDALRLVGIGMVIGAIALYFAVQFVEKMLYGVSGFDPASLLATGIPLTVVALIAGLLPALRAASIDPLKALRGE